MPAPWHAVVRVASESEATSFAIACSPTYEPVTLAVPVGPGVVEPIDGTPVWSVEYTTWVGLAFTPPGSVHVMVALVTVGTSPGDSRPVQVSDESGLTAVVTTLAATGASGLLKLVPVQL